MTLPVIAFTFLFSLYLSMMIKLSPRQVFLLDSAGALVTAFFTGVILTCFETYFGMPSAVCYVLAAVAVIFAIYSFTCALRLEKKYAPFLKIIAISNGIYVLIATGFAVYHFSELTKLGVSYFVAETIVVAFVIALEWRVANQFSAHKNQLSNFR